VQQEVGEIKKQVNFENTTQTIMYKSYCLPIFLLLLLFSQTDQVTAQEQPQPKTFRNNITVNITRLFLLEPRIGYEFSLTERHIVRATVGIKLSTSAGTFKSFAEGIPKNYQVTKGGYVSVGYNYVFNTRFKFYVSAEIYYHYLFYNDKYYRNCTGMDMESYVSLQSLDLEKGGLKILSGKKMMLVSGGKAGLSMDFFVGLGVQYRYEDLTVYEKKEGDCYYDISELNQLDPPCKQLRKFFIPTMSVGVLMGLPF
jgi:hypothetical protein